MESSKSTIRHSEISSGVFIPDIYDKFSSEGLYVSQIQGETVIPWKNLTADWIFSEAGKDTLVELAKTKGFVPSFLPDGYETFTEEEKIGFQRSTLWDNFNFDMGDVLDNFCPIHNYIFPLESSPSAEAIKECFEAYSGISLIQDVNGISYISFTTLELESPEALAYSYLVVDGKVPRDIVDLLQSGKENISSCLLPSDKFEKLNSFLNAVREAPFFELPGVVLESAGASRVESISFCATREDAHHLRDSGQVLARIVAVEDKIDQLGRFLETLQPGTHLVSAFKNDLTGEELKKQLESAGRDSCFAVWHLPLTDIAPVQPIMDQADQGFFQLKSFSEDLQMQAALREQEDYSKGRGI